MKSVKNLKSPDLESGSKYSSLAACKVWILLEQGKDSFFILQVWVEFGNLKIYFTRPGPPVRGQHQFLTVRASDRSHAARHWPSYRVVTARSAESAQAPVTTGRRRCPCWGGPYLALRRVPPTLLLPLALYSASFFSAARLTIEHHPIQLHRHSSQWTAPPSSIAGVATPSSLSHRPRHRVRLHPWPLLPLWVGCRQPPCFDLLQVSRPHHKLQHCSPVLPDPRFYYGSHWSEPSSSTTSPPTALPLTSRLSEPLFSQPPAIDSLWDKLHPQLLLLCHLTTDWPESFGGAVPVKGGDGYPASIDGAERLRWARPL
jgi:hypothetical protein